MSAAADHEALLNRLEAVERELLEFRHRHGIEEVLLRYARALDWLDDALLETVIFDDAVIDYGFFKGLGREFKPILMQVERSAVKRWHGSTQVTIQLDGDSAHVESYQFSASTIPGSPPPQTTLMNAYGYYMDRMEYRKGQWGIAARKHILLAGQFQPDISGEGMLATLNHLGEATTAHPDYHRARLPR